MSGEEWRQPSLSSTSPSAIPNAGRRKARGLAPSCQNHDENRSFFLFKEDLNFRLRDSWKDKNMIPRQSCLLVSSSNQGRLRTRVLVVHFRNKPTVWNKWEDNCSYWSGPKGSEACPPALPPIFKPWPIYHQRLSSSVLEWKILWASHRLFCITVAWESLPHAPIGSRLTGTWKQWLLLQDLG